jgi:hypothetical protein
MVLPEFGVASKRVTVPVPHLDPLVSDGAAGSGFTGTDIVFEQPALLVKVIVAEPAAIPVTTPLVETVAIEELLLTQGFANAGDDAVVIFTVLPIHTPEAFAVNVGFGFTEIVAVSDVWVEVVIQLKETLAMNLVVCVILV